MYVRPLITYAALAWLPKTCKSSAKYLRAVQTKALRMALSTWEDSIVTMNNKAGIPSFEDFTTKLTTDFFEKLATAEEHLAAIGDYGPKKPATKGRRARYKTCKHLLIPP